VVFGKNRANYIRSVPRNISPVLSAIQKAENQSTLFYYQIQKSM